MYIINKSIQYIYFVCTRNPKQSVIREVRLIAWYLNKSMMVYDDKDNDKS